jgi:PadR family transcriptional regulator AphA
MLEQTSVTPLLSTNDAAVLGLLAGGETSGYDLDKRIRRSVGLMWTPAKSHVYGTLTRLVDAGYASVRHVEQTQRPDKRLFRITDRGENALSRWLHDAPLEPTKYRNQFLLKVFFGRHMDREALIRHIEEGRADVQEELSQLEALEKDVDPDRDFFGWLTLTYGLDRDRATVRWADMALRALRERNDR